MSGIVLYGPAIAPYTEKVVRGLGLKKLPFELKEPQEPEDYRRWSPETGLLPVLAFDGEPAIGDSTRILIELDKRFPNPPLLASDPSVAARQRRLEDWADESFFWYWNQWRTMLEERGDLEPAEPYQFSWARPSSWFESLRAAGAGAVVDRSRERFLLAEIDHRMDDLLAWLGPRPYFYADEPSMADLAVYAMLRNIRGGTFGPGGVACLERRPPLLDFMRRIEDRTGAPPAAAPAAV